MRPSETDQQTWILDTDHVSAHQHGNQELLARLATHDPARILVTVITYEESLRGRLAVVHGARSTRDIEVAYARLHEAWAYFRRRQVLPFNAPAIAAYQRLRKTLRQRVGAQDLKIAAVALTHGAVVVTRNQRDFGQVPGLVTEDWLDA